MSRLTLKCDNSAFGCEAVLKLDALTSHLNECEHNPKKPMTCDQGCGLVIPKDELKVVSAIMILCIKTNVEWLFIGNLNLILPFLALSTTLTIIGMERSS